MIFSNTNLKESLFQYLKNQVSSLHSKSALVPNLIVVQSSDNLANRKYGEMKHRLGNLLGISVINQYYNLTDFKKLFQQTNQGIILQLPAPNDYKEIIQDMNNWTNSNYDVDFLCLKNISKYWYNHLLPPTIQSIDLTLKNILLPEFKQIDVNLIDQLIEHKLNLRKKTVLVIGQGELIGGFLLNYLKDREATIISANKYSQNIQSLAQYADIIISAAGALKLINYQWLTSSDKNLLKKDLILIDAGTTENSGQLVGDIDHIDLENNFTDKERANVTLVTSPGGIGPITVLSLFYNLLEMSRKNYC
jgi:5,10-methylene-tetrahydrofolate dehydrogenase/methenyl tetrahydrofolate cyclohydrolase